VTGLIVGVIAVLLTENIGINLLGAFGVDLPWGRWPLTLHSAAWGVLLNLLVAVSISAFTQNEEDRKHRMSFHSFLREHASLPAKKRHLIPLGWIVVIVWFFFAMGPGSVIGNWLFGDPNNPDTWWVFGMPSIWVWQLIWWVLGIAMMWFMCYKLEMSTVPEKEVEVLYDEDANTRMDVSRP
ncbi:MAG: sodium:solute symporter family protein, partial [Halorhodospira sp.]